MYDFTQGFILSKSTHQKKIIHNKNSRKNKKENKKKDNIIFVWYLFEYLGLKIKHETVQFGRPSSDLGFGLNSQFVLTQLNQKQCFDFDYQPKEGDNLIIMINTGLNRIEFIFKNNIWVEDYYNPFMDEYLQTEKGVVLEI